MDWYKAKNIIIFILVAINLYLFYSIFSYWQEQGISKEALTDSVDILKKRGVSLGCKLPATKQNLPKLVYRDNNNEFYLIASMLMDGSTVSSDQIGRCFSKGSKSMDLKSSHSFEYRDTKPASKVNISQRNVVENYAKDFLKKNGIKISEFAVDSYSEIQDKIKITFIGRFRDYYIYRNEIAIDITSQGVNYLKYSYRQVDKFLSESEDIVVMPVHEILLKNLSCGSNMTIEHIDLGYGVPDEYNEIMEDYSGSPVWRITLKDGTIKYYEGKIGKEIK